MGRSMGRFSIPKIGGGDGPKVAPAGGGQEQGIGTLMGYIMGQQKSQQSQEQLGPDAIVTGGKNPVSGVRSITPGGQQASAQTELIGDSLKKAKAAADAYNLVDQYHQRFRALYSDLAGTEGMDGAKAAAQKYVSGQSLKGDPKLQAYLSDLPNIVGPLQRTFAETGNVAMQKEVREGKALPNHAPGMPSFPANPTGLPDDYKTADDKFNGLKHQLMNTLLYNLDQSKSGQVKIPTETNGQTSSPTVSDPSQQADPKAEYQLANQAIQSGKIKDINKVKAAFKNRTGEDYDSFQQ